MRQRGACTTAIFAKSPKARSTSFFVTRFRSVVPLPGRDVSLAYRLEL